MPQYHTRSEREEAERARAVRLQFERRAARLKKMIDDRLPDLNLATEVAGILDDAVRLFPNQLRNAIEVMETPQKPILALLRREHSDANDESVGIGANI